LVINEKLLDIAYLFSDRIKYVITYNKLTATKAYNIINTTPFVAQLNSKFFRTSYIDMLVNAKVKYDYKCIINKNFVNNMELINSVPNNSIICFPQRSDKKETLNSDVFKPFLEKFYDTNKIYTNIVKNGFNNTNQIILEKTEPISIKIFDLVYLCSIKNIVIIGNRCGLLDLIYFTYPNTTIINLIPSNWSSLLSYNFFNNPIFNNNINIKHLKHNNGLDILLSDYDINNYLEFMKTVFVV
jgi:hypothetical protein